MRAYGRLLGSPQLRVGETWYDPPLTKASALLFYLACRGGWVSRDELLYVFYPDSPETPARSSFRHLLTAVRRLPYSEGLETQDSRVRWQIETDVDQFKKAVNEEKWTKALELYQGELLQNFNPHDLSEFDNWLALERQTLHSSWRNASLTFANELAASERHALAAEVLAALYKADSLDEDVLRVYLETLYLSNQRGKALEIFDNYKNTLHHELSSEVEASTLELVTLIREDKPLQARSSVAVKTRVAEFPDVIKPHHNLPVQPTEFIGRELEKAKLAALFAEKTCRLVTIVAPGGMGKTRLAIEVAKTQLEHFSESCFVSFAAVASPDLMVYTLADALELSLFGATAPREQVLDYLKNKKLFLVFDNLEHLLADVDFLNEILATSAELKILATSRERLSLQSEHLFDLYGLTVEGSHDSDALRLFAERAKHNRLDFVLEQTLEAVTKICQLVGGMPLAIELAASWSRLLTPSEIVTELEGNFDLLSSQSRDLLERHHSMRGVFEVSWQRLSEEEQRALRKLSVFQGGFTKEAARAVADADLTLLLSLLNKSFVWRDAAGRFSQHPLIHQYALQKAIDYPEEKKQLEEKHGLYYLELVKELAQGLRTRSGKETYRLLEKDFPNIRAAWNWTLRETRVEEIKRYVQVLLVFLDSHNNYEGVAMFKQTVAALDEGNPKHHAALGYALIYQAWLENRLNYNANSLIELTQHGITLLEPLNEYSGISWGLMNLGGVATDQGDFVKAKELFTTALNLARAHGKPLDIARALYLLSMNEVELNSFAEVKALMPTRLEELREIGDVPSLGNSLAVFGYYLVENDQLDEGEKLLQESLDFVRTSDFYATPLLTRLAKLAYRRGDFSRSETLAREAFEITSKYGFMNARAIALAVLGRVKLAQGHLGEAEQLMIEGLKLAWDATMLFAVSYALLSLAELNITKGHVKQGVRLLSFISRLSAIEKFERNEALKLLEKAKEQLSPRAFSEAQEASKSLTLEQIVTEILGHD